MEISHSFEKPIILNPYHFERVICIYCENLIAFEQFYRCKDCDEQCHRRCHKKFLCKSKKIKSENETVTQIQSSRENLSQENPTQGQDVNNCEIILDEEIIHKVESDATFIGHVFVKPITKLSFRLKACMYCKKVNIFKAVDKCRDRINTYYHPKCHKKFLQMEEQRHTFEELKSTKIIEISNEENIVAQASVQSISDKEEDQLQNTKTEKNLFPAYQEPNTSIAVNTVKDIHEIENNEEVISEENPIQKPNKNVMDEGKSNETVLGKYNFTLEPNLG